MTIAGYINENIAGYIILGIAVVILLITIFGKIKY